MSSNKSLGFLLLLTGVGIIAYPIVMELNGFVMQRFSPFILWGLALIIFSSIMFSGIKVLCPQEAIVFTFFGEYYGTLKGAGIHFVNPLCRSFLPKISAPTSGGFSGSTAASSFSLADLALNKMSLKTKTINNDKQKVNDLLGNPIVVDTMVVWRIVDTAKVAFDVENYIEFLSSQCDASLRNVMSLYPYDQPEATSGKSLRCSIHDISEELKLEIQEKVGIAGLEITEAKITNMYYAPEIANAMLQRQQAQAITDAKQTIVEGAVDIVEMALNRLSANEVVQLDEERKAAMVSNLLVVLCGNKDATPVVNSGSLY